MKPKLLALFVLTGLLYSCNEEPSPERVNEGIHIYKTRGDYSDNVFVNMVDGKVFGVPSLYNSYAITEDCVFLISRVRLINGYILDRTSSIIAAVTDYTIEEYYNMEYVQKILPSKKELQNRIIDMDPYLEFYQDIDDSIWFQPIDTAIINEIIRTNQIDKYFEKLK